MVTSAIPGTSRAQVQFPSQVPYSSSASDSTNVLAYRRRWAGMASEAAANTMNSAAPSVSTPAAAAASE
ncbi:MAG: hypothetical protein E6H44_04640 [Betaproteobacteria bacterium]|nr:MAG: hypothetical protein E6H44_04640 [Betaproteobacteria bacterium]TMI03870.1 MAG: hypothetical protein E6H43_03610 [Betaproteobacteria bacterium]TMI04190.1 MAG: hypothetical protein E6H40_19470 [Betaproteobacteria bacterium]